MNVRAPTRPTCRPRLPVSLLAVLALAPAALAAQTGDPDHEWCRDDGSRDRERYCEVREFALRPTGSLQVDATPNGGVRVEAWDRQEVRVLARVVADARSEADAREIASEVRIRTEDGRVEAEGPRRTGRGEGWHVSFRVSAPAASDVSARTVNGGVSVSGMRGRIEARTTNGGVRLNDLAGDVSARTTNGGITVDLTGSAWDGAGLEARTTNGGVTLRIPDGYSARLEASTTNGGVNSDVPLTVRGRIDRRIEATLGGGGAPIRVSTTNGGIRIQNR